MSVLYVIYVLPQCFKNNIRKDHFLPQDSGRKRERFLFVLWFLLTATGKFVDFKFKPEFRQH